MRSIFLAYLMIEASIDAVAHDVSQSERHDDLHRALNALWWWDLDDVEIEALHNDARACVQSHVSIEQPRMT